MINKELNDDIASHACCQTCSQARTTLPRKYFEPDRLTEALLFVVVVIHAPNGDICRPVDGVCDASSSQTWKRLEFTFSDHRSLERERAALRRRTAATSTAADTRRPQDHLHEGMRAL